MISNVEMYPLKHEVITQTIRAGTDYSYVTQQEGYNLIAVIPRNFQTHNDFVIGICKDNTVWDVFWKSVISSSSDTTITCDSYWMATD